jgi:hypothetical protein
LHCINTVHNMHRETLKIIDDLFVNMVIIYERIN